MSGQSDVVAQSPQIDYLFNQIPIPLSLYNRDGLQIAMNNAHVELWNIERDKWIGQFNFIQDEQLVAIGSRDMFKRVMQGETLRLPAHRYDMTKSGLESNLREERWLEAIYFPVFNNEGEVELMGAILLDVTEAQLQKRVIEEAQEEIVNQQAMIEMLSSPVVQVWQGILMIPMVGAIDSQRAQIIISNLLEKITQTRAQCVILDITGVPIIDTRVAQYLISTAQACRLLGCEAALVGIGVELAQTLVQLGVDLSTLVTLADLQAGVAWAFSRCKLQVTPLDSQQSRTNGQAAQFPLAR
jgi:rsbT co-antagonist protein RsbR